MRFLILSILLITNISHSHTIKYQKCNLTLSEIIKADKEWINYNETIYNGLNNGVYWFKVKIDPSSENHVIHFPESHVTRVDIYKSNGEIIPKKSPSRYLNFEISNSNKSETYYIKVDCFLDATILFKIDTLKDYNDTEVRNTIKMIVYYGIVISVILFHLMSFLFFKNITYLYYALTALGMALSIFYKDGLTAYIFGAEGINEYLEPILDSVLFIGGVTFINSFLKLYKRHPKYFYSAVIIFPIYLITYSLFLVQESFIYFAITMTLIMFAYDILFFAALKLWNKHFEAKVFVTAYFFQFLFAHGYYISQHFGSSFLLLPLDFFKYGSILEMGVFTSLIIYQSKRINKEKILNIEKIEEYKTQIRELDELSNERKADSSKILKEYNFTKKELEIIDLIIEGNKNKVIASKLFISENTVKYHNKNILSKFNVENKKEVLLKYNDLINKK
jgi:two-component system, sensor histidine kinase LadS